MRAKNQDRSASKISSKKQVFSADFISGSRDFTQDLTSGVLILSHSPDACVCARSCSSKPFRVKRPFLCVFSRINSAGVE